MQQASSQGYNPSRSVTNLGVDCLVARKPSLCSVWRCVWASWRPSGFFVGYTLPSPLSCHFCINPLPPSYSLELLQVWSLSPLLPPALGSIPLERDPWDCDISLGWCAPISYVTSWYTPMVSLTYYMII